MSKVHAHFFQGRKDRPLDWDTIRVDNDEKLDVEEEHKKMAITDSGVTGVYSLAALARAPPKRKRRRRKKKKGTLPYIPPTNSAAAASRAA